MANTDGTNIFARYGFSPYAGSLDANLTQANNQQRTIFTGGDLHAYINHIPVTNLESCTWSIQTDVAGNYVMGKRDAVAYTTGKRAIVGNLVFSLYDKHALLEEVFGVTDRGFNTQGSLNSGDNNIIINATQTSPIAVTSTTPGAVNTAINRYSYAVGTNPNTSVGNAYGLRGLSLTDYQAFVSAAAKDTAKLVGATTVNYSDQLPPFDLTLIGVTRDGRAAKASIFGIQITQETSGFSSADMSNATGFTFVALAVVPWRPLDSTGGIIGTSGA